MMAGGSAVTYRRARSLAANGPDQTFDVRTLPRTHGAADRFGDPHACHPATERRAVNAVVISQQPAWCRVLRKRVDHLLGRPRCGRMVGHIDVNDAPSL